MSDVGKQVLGTVESDSSLNYYDVIQLPTRETATTGIRQQRYDSLQLGSEQRILKKRGL